ncbi:MAG: phosphoribosylaminoimidazolesuccinocarboxamide synthase [bacterium]|nr:phosphoribosylaminoimidazolesuccinocarboxamide synthase [bacterium]
MTEVLKETNFSNLGEKKTGKVRDIYIQPERLVLVTTDRHSSFDRIIAHIPHKGQVLNQISAFWFEQTKDIIPNHVLAIPDPNVTIGKKCTMVPVEAVVRGYVTGVTGTSIWTRYSKGKRDFGDIVLPDGLKKNQKLPHPIFDPTTKEDTHDRTLSLKEMVSEGLVTAEILEQIQKTALALFARGEEIAKSRGLILVDTKYEFGLDKSDLSESDKSDLSKGRLVLIDEIHTPDSSRYWQADSYEERFSKGEEPQYFDKEFLRLWFREHCDPYKDATLPEAPKELVQELSRRYIQMFEQITGKKFVPGEEPIIPRMEKNLSAYSV